MILMRNKIFLLTLVLIGIFIIIYFGLKSANASSKNNIDPFEKDTFEILEKIKDKTYNKYNIGTIRINHEDQNNSNEINIEIIGNQKYYDSVKDEVKELVKDTIKSTTFEKYLVNIDKSEINQLVSEELKEEHLLILDIMKIVHNNLSEYFPNQIDEIGLDNTASKLSIEVRTLLKEQKLKDIKKEIESEIFTILSKDKIFLDKVVKEKPIEIRIYDENGKEINK